MRWVRWPIDRRWAPFYGVIIVLSVIGVVLMLLAK